MDCCDCVPHLLRLYEDTAFAKEQNLLLDVKLAPGWEISTFQVCFCGEEKMYVFATDVVRLTLLSIAIEQSSTFRFFSRKHKDCFAAALASSERRVSQFEEAFPRVSSSLCETPLPSYSPPPNALA